jgi:hypothetical protein
MPCGESCTGPRTSRPVCFRANRKEGLMPKLLAANKVTGAFGGAQNPAPIGEDQPASFLFLSLAQRKLEDNFAC